MYAASIRRTGEVVHTAAAPVHVRCGFALADEAVYFGSGADALAVPAAAAGPRRGKETERAMKT